MSSLQGTIMGSRVASVQGGNPPTYLCARGFEQSVGITRNGPGDYTMTLGVSGLAPAQGVIQACAGNNTLAAVSVEWLTNTTIRVRLAALTTAGPVIAATDMNYWVQVSQVGPS